jgi:hypothetical protein
MTLLRSVLFLCVVTVLIIPSAASADWINLSGAENARNIAEIYVETDRVRIQLEVFVDDLMIFEELIPEDFFSEPLPGRPSLAKRQQIFAEAWRNASRSLPKGFSRSSRTRARNYRSTLHWSNRESA